MSNYISMREIARTLEVSPSTISRALKNDPSISEEMKAKVRAVANRMGYRPSPSLGILNELRWSGRRSPEHPTVAYLTWHRYDTHNVVKSLIRELVHSGTEAGFRVVSFYLEDYETPAAGLEVLYQQGVHGLILGRVHSKEELEGCDWSRFSVVATAHVQYLPPFHLVTTNPTTPLRQLWEIACRYGAERIGLVLTDDPLSAFFAELRGWLHVLQSQIQPSRRLPIHTYRPGATAAANRRLRRWMTSHRPDTVISFGDEIYFELQKMGYEIPGKLRFASLRKTDGRTSPSATHDEIAGLMLNSQLLARLTIERLGALIRRNELGVPATPLRVLVDRLWVPGNSLPGAELHQSRGVATARLG